jgi:hypothetical protein
MNKFYVCYVWHGYLDGELTTGYSYDYCQLAGHPTQVEIEQMISTLMTIPNSKSGGKRLSVTILNLIKLS